MNTVHINLYVLIVEFWLENINFYKTIVGTKNLPRWGGTKVCWILQIQNMLQGIKICLTNMQQQKKWERNEEHPN